MAENEDGFEKTEQPTERRLQQAREKGQAPRSRELTTLLLLLASATIFLFYGASMVDLARRSAHTFFTVDRELIYDPERAVAGAFDALLDVFIGISPVLGLLLLTALFGPMVLGGWIFTAENLAPKLDKLNPVKGLKKVFGAQGLVELLKALGKFALVTGGAVFIILAGLDLIMRTSLMTVDAALRDNLQLLALSFLGLSALLIFVVVVDVPFQLWQHTRQLRMTRQEIKDELKETEGQPEVKQRIRFLQREMSLQRMIFAVPAADVVVTNPTHYAVALKYDAAAGGAPRVLAKGIRKRALRIKGLAADLGVPTIEDRPLARALYAAVPEGHEIPEDLYTAVAAVLAEVYRRRDRA